MGITWGGFIEGSGTLLSILSPTKGTTVKAVGSALEAWQTGTDDQKADAVGDATLALGTNGIKHVLGYIGLGDMEIMGLDVSGYLSMAISKFLSDYMEELFKQYQNGDLGSLSDLFDLGGDASKDAAKAAYEKLDLANGISQVALYDDYATPKFAANATGDAKSQYETRMNALNREIAKTDEALKKARTEIPDTYAQMKAIETFEGKPADKKVINEQTKAQFKADILRFKREYDAMSPEDKEKALKATREYANKIQDKGRGSSEGTFVQQAKQEIKGTYDDVKKAEETYRNKVAEASATKEIYYTTDKAFNLKGGNARNQAQKSDTQKAIEAAAVQHKKDGTIFKNAKPKPKEEEKSENKDKNEEKNTEANKKDKTTETVTKTATIVAATTGAAGANELVNTTTKATKSYASSIKDNVESQLSKEKLKVVDGLVADLSNIINEEKGNKEILNTLKVVKEEKKIDPKEIERKRMIDVGKKMAHEQGLTLEDFKAKGVSSENSRAAYESYLKANEAFNKEPITPHKTTPTNVGAIPGVGGTSNANAQNRTNGQGNTMPQNGQPQGNKPQMSQAQQQAYQLMQQYGPNLKRGQFKTLDGQKGMSADEKELWKAYKDTRNQMQGGNHVNVDARKGERAVRGLGKLIESIGDISFKKEDGGFFKGLGDSFDAISDAQRVGRDARQTISVGRR